MKKNNPGCICCGESDCEQDCWYGCTGGSPPCPMPCLKINMPTPDDVGTANGPNCPPAECDITAKCNSCLEMLDTIFVPRQTSNEEYFIYEYGECADFTVEFQPTYQSSAFIPGVNCWTVRNYACPYDNTIEFYPCESEYLLRYVKVFWNVKRVSGCAETTITIEYEVAERCDVLAIPPNPPLEPATKYQHIFKKTHCECDDVYGTIPFDSTVSTNNAREITVPDVCNADSATVELIGDCAVCRCFDCGTGDILISIASGFCVLGTIAIAFQPGVYYPKDCYYATQITCPDGQIFFIGIRIECEPCEKYTLRLAIQQDIAGYFYSANYILENLGCGEGGTFTHLKSFPLDNWFSDVVISLSSL